MTRCRIPQLITRITDLGKTEQFKPKEESITVYLERVELNSTVNNITIGENLKKVTVFPSVVMQHSSLHLVERFSVTSKTKRENI